MELELKHLAGYLPYGLKVFRENKSIESDTFFIVGASKTCVLLQNSGLAVVDMERIKPILRPLSDLAKEIEVDGEQFVPKSILFKLFGGMAQFQILEKGFYSLNYGCYLKIEQLPHNIVSQLLEWHFDIYGLIENGLAISIHDVEEAGI